MPYIYSGDLSVYRESGISIRLNESNLRTRNFSATAIHSASRPTVFVSHKHSDLSDLGDLIAFLEKQYNVITYIDSRDKGMPEKTCVETAERIKEVIAFCDRFILMATDNAIQSMWCNWEVGIADKTKYPCKQMAILPLLKRGQREDNFSGNEYLGLYPYITRERSSYNGTYVFYVVDRPSGKKCTLRQWLETKNLLLG